MTERKGQQLPAPISDQNSTATDDLNPSTSYTVFGSTQNSRPSADLLRVCSSSSIPTVMHPQAEQPRASSRVVPSASYILSPQQSHLSRLGEFGSLQPNQTQYSQHTKVENMNNVDHGNRQNGSNSSFSGSTASTTECVPIAEESKVGERIYERQDTANLQLLCSTFKKYCPNYAE